MTVSSTKLRENIYQLLDQVLETGEPLEVMRKGRKLVIAAERTKGRLANLRKRATLAVDADEIVHLDWSKHWKP